MKRWIVAGVLCCALALGGWAESAPCLIVKHKGTIGRRLIWTAVLAMPIAPGAKFDLVDSVNVSGVHLKWKTEELDRVSNRGVRVIVLPTNYRVEELQDARRECAEGKAPNLSLNAPAAPPDTAAQHFASGESLMKERRFMDALLEYRMALDIEPLNPTIREREAAAEAAVSAERGN